MAAATKALKAFTVRFEISGDAAEDAEPWVVYTPDGDFETCFETLAEAVAHAAECTSTLADDTEAEEEAEREELVAAIQAHVEEMGLKELRRMAKRLGV